MNQDPIRMTSLALVSAILEQRADINRLILKRIDDTTWEVTLLDERRPNDLRRMAELSAGRYSYERNVKRGFESIAGYDIGSDCQYRVIYRLPQGHHEHLDARAPITSGDVAMTKTVQSTYQNTPINGSATYPCLGTAPDVLARFQNEVAELQNLEEEHRIRIEDLHRESFTGHRYVDIVRFTRLK